MSGCILGCQYIPSAEYFAHWLHHGTIQIEAWENFQKRSWRNRTQILFESDPVSLTIPLRKGKHQQLNIRSVTITFEQPWNTQHLSAIQSAYGKTAFGQEVIEGLKPILLSASDNLWDLNISLLTYITSLLPGQWNWTFTDRYEFSLKGIQIDLRSGLPAKIPALSPLLVPSYPQIHRLHLPFQANLSILDALCHLGPGTLNYLSRYASQLYSPHESDR